MPNSNTPSGEAAQTSASATSKLGLGREAQAALLRVNTRPEFPEGNLRELTWYSKPDCQIATTQKALCCNSWGRKESDTTELLN